MIKLNERDLKILSILQQNGRIAKTELAVQVNLSPTACWERLKRLEENGVIEGYGARLSFASLGGPSIIFMQLEIDSHKAEDFEKFETAIKGIPEIVECMAVGGGVDYFMKFICENVDAYQRLVDSMLESDIGLKRYYTYIVTKPVKSMPPPLSVISKQYLD